MICPCDTGLSYSDCCEKYHNGAPTPNAISLMRSRYSAFALQLAPYLANTLDPSKHSQTEIDDLVASFKGTTWVYLKTFDEIQLSTDSSSVKFVAQYQHDGAMHAFAEHSKFKKLDDRWVYIDGEFEAINVIALPKRNDSCWCRSGRKFKKCHG